ncbi:MAG: hypothetical protein HQ592_07515 [Planctomycetes bacterium]|nr:hypothetical protein [Planctomycetota bacterium]
MNKEKAVFALAIVLAVFTGFKITANALKMKNKAEALPESPRAEHIELSKSDDQLREDISPRFFNTFWDFGTRNPFQRPEAHIQAEGHFTLTEQNGRIVVNGFYQCKSDGPIDKLRIAYRKQWTASSGSGEIKLHKGPSRNLLNVSEVTFEEIQEGNFKIPLSFKLVAKWSPTVRFPDIAMIDVDGELGYVAVKSTRAYKFVPKPSDGLSKAAPPPRDLRKADAVFKYNKHPYRLTVGIVREQKIAVRPKDRPKPPSPKTKPKPKTTPKTKPKTKPDEKPPDDGDGEDADAPFELPFTFKAVIKIGKQFVVLEDKDSGELVRCVVGDTLNDLTVVEIYATSVVLEDKEGNAHELLDPIREKYD